MKKVLLDENPPVKLKYSLQDSCEIYTVKDKGWNALENGDLLNAMQREEFDYLLTSDKNLQHQQNIIKYNNLTIFVMICQFFVNFYKKIIN